MKILSILIFIFLAQDSFSQLSLSDTTRRVPFDTNKIKQAVYLSNTSEVFSYDSLYIWSDKRSLSEVMDERPAYFINDFGLGGRNEINYGSNLFREVGIFRDGIQINDPFFQGFDIQNFSINEIDRIEEISPVSSFYYGINTAARVINVITKDYFQPTPFSQLRYSQDREGSLFADVIFNQPISRKFDVQLGVTKHSMDGRYANSAFDVWRGRARVSYYPSPKFNLKLNFYLDNFDRQLNNGLVYNPDKNVLLDPSEATVVNPSATENLENYYYDATLTGKFFKESNSLTKLKLYSNNSIRRLVDPLDTSSFGQFFDLPTGYIHTIQYAADLSQNYIIKHNRTTYSDISAGANLYLNFFTSSYFIKKDPVYYSLKAKYDFSFKSLLISAMVRNDNLSKQNFLNSGIESSLNLSLNKDFSLLLKGGISQSNYLLTNQVYDLDAESVDIYKEREVHLFFGASLKYKNSTLYGNFNSTKWSELNSLPVTFNAGFNLNFSNAQVSVDASHSNLSNLPSYYVKSDIAYKGILFRGKLNVRTGFNIKYYRIEEIIKQNQSSYNWWYTNTSFPQQNQFIVDFYVGARIGRANINLTLANLFNSLVYNSYLFPLDDRGGFANVVSRFTIVWDFIN